MLILGREGRYRHEQAQPRGEWVTTAACDGETSWEQEYDPMSGASQTSRWSYVRPLASLSPPVSELLRPSWLPAGFQLEVIGPATACGRDAVEFAGRPRPRVVHVPIGDRVVAVADLELGILLRCEWLSGEDATGTSRLSPVTSGSSWPAVTAKLPGSRNTTR